MKWFNKVRRKPKVRLHRTDTGVSQADDKVSVGSEEPTLNDVSEYVTEIQEALRDARQRIFNKDYSAPKLGPLVAKLERKVPTLSNTVLPPLIKHAMLKNLNPLIQRAIELGDKYIPKMLEELDAGIVEHVPQYLWLSYLNQIRLAYAQQPLFENLRKYILEKYNDDVSSPEGHTAFIPAKGSGPDGVWEKVAYLEEQGLVLVRETVKLTSPELAESQDMAIITMSDVVS